MRYAVTRRGRLLLKATEPVAPGSRGGKGYRTRTGTWRYGERGHTPRRSRVLLSELHAAVADAKRRWPNEPNADRLAILMHPHVYGVWQRLNREAFPHLAPHEIETTPHGFRLYRPFSGGGRMYWNGRDPERNPHGENPGNAYNGVWRETVHHFLDDMAAIAGGYDSDTARNSAEMQRAYRAGLRIVGSTAPPPDAPIGSKWERPSGEVVEVIGAEDDDLITRNAEGKRGRMGISAIRGGRVFAKSEPVQRPGSRGGRYRIDARGNIRYDNLSERIERKRAQLARLVGPTAHESAMAASFPLGAGFGHGSQRKRERAMDRSIDRAILADKVRRELNGLEARQRREAEPPPPPPEPKPKAPRKPSVRRVFVEPAPGATFRELTLAEYRKREKMGYAGVGDDGVPSIMADGGLVPVKITDAPSRPWGGGESNA